MIIIQAVEELFPFIRSLENRMLKLKRNTDFAFDKFWLKFVQDT